MNRAICIGLLAVLAASYMPSAALGVTGGRPRRVEVAKKPPREKPLTKAEVREAETTLGDLGYWVGPIDGVLDDCSRNALVAFQKIERREPSGKLSRTELEYLLSAGAPSPLESGYAHFEVDIALQVLFYVEEDGTVTRVTPVSTGNNALFRVYGEPNRAYTPRGRFEVYSKGSGWQESPLGLLYYPSYLIGGIAIHGNPAVPTTPASHGCIRVPMCLARELATLLPVGSKVIIHDGGSFANGLVPWPDDPKDAREDAAEEQ
jgi:hypothetical protein